MTKTVNVGVTITKLKPGISFPMGVSGAWFQVLSVDDESETALVIAEKPICNRPYDEEGNAGWEECSLRKWLNHEYYEVAFSDEEKEAIVRCNPEGNPLNGNDHRSKDRIFLLDSDDINRYKQIFEGKIPYCWWIRSSEQMCIDVSAFGPGILFNIGPDASRLSGVRPVFWVDLNSSFFRSMATDRNHRIIHIPDLVVKGSRIFSVRSDIEALNVPEGITEIPDHCFHNSKKLKRVTIPSSVRKIGKDVFSGCDQLEVVRIPKKVETISGKDITTAEGKMLKIDSCVYADGMLFCEGVTELIVPEGVREIPAFCFESMVNLKKVTLPASLRKVGRYAFYCCEKLTDLVVHSNSVSYGKDAIDPRSELTYTPDMFRTTGKLCDSFLMHLDVCGVEELAMILMAQQRRSWEKALLKYVKADQEGYILESMTSHLKNRKRISKKAVEAAASYVSKNAALLPSEIVRSFCDVLTEKNYAGIAEKLRNNMENRFV